MEKRPFDARLLPVKESKATATSQAEVHRLQQILSQHDQKSTAEKDLLETQMYALQQKLSFAQSENNDLKQENMSLHVSLKKLDSTSAPKEIIERDNRCSMCDILEHQRKNADPSDKTSEAVKNSVLELERKHKRDLKQAEKTYQTKLEDREGEHAGEIKRLQKQLNRANAAKEQNENRQASAITKMNEATILRLQTEAATQLQQAGKRDELISSLQSQLEVLQAEHATNAKRVKDAEQRAAEARLRQTVIEKSKTAAETEHAQQLFELKNMHKTEKAKIEEQAKAKADAYISKYNQLQRQTNCLQEHLSVEKQNRMNEGVAWKNQMQALEKKHAELLEQSSREQQQLEMEYSKQHAEMSRVHEREVSDLKQQLQQALKATEAVQQLQALLAEQNATYEDVKKSLAESEKKFLNEEKSHHDLRVRSSEQMHATSNTLNAEIEKWEKCVQQLEMKMKEMETFHQTQLRTQKLSADEERAQLIAKLQASEQKEEQACFELQRQRMRNEEAENQLEVCIQENHVTLERMNNRHERAILDIEHKHQGVIEDFLHQQACAKQDASEQASKLRLIEMQATIRAEQLSASHASTLQTLAMQHEQSVREQAKNVEALTKCKLQIESLHREHEEIMKSKDIEMKKQLEEIVLTQSHEKEQIMLTFEKEKAEKFSKLQALGKMEINKITKMYEARILDLQATHNEQLVCLQEINKEQKEAQKVIFSTKMKELEKVATEASEQANDVICELKQQISVYENDMQNAREHFTQESVKSREAAVVELAEANEQKNSQISQISAALTQSEERVTTQAEEIRICKLSLEENDQKMKEMNAQREEFLNVNKQLKDQIESEMKRHENILALVNNQAEMERESLCVEAKEQISKLLREKEEVIVRLQKEKDEEISCVGKLQQQEISALRQEQKQQISLLQKEKEEQIRDVCEIKTKEIEDLKEKASKEIHVLNENVFSFKKEIENMLLSHTHALSCMEEKHTVCVETLKLQLSEVEKQNAALQWSLSQQQTEMQEQYAELKKESEKRVYEVREEVEKKMSEMENLRKLLSEKEKENDVLSVQTKSVKEEYENTFLALKEQTAKKIESLQTAHTHSLNALQAIHSEQTQMLSSVWEEKFQSASVQLEAMSVAKYASEKHAIDLKERHVFEMEDLSSRLRAEAETMKTQLSSQLQIVENKHIALSLELEELQARYQQELEDSREEFNDVLSSMKEKHAEEIVHISRVNQEQVHNLQKEMSVLRGECEITNSRLSESLSEAKELSERLSASKITEQKPEVDSRKAKELEGEVVKLKKQHSVDLMKLGHKIKMEANKDNELTCKQAVEAAETALEDRLRREFNRELEKLKKDHSKQNELNAKKLESAIRRPLQEMSSSSAFQPSSMNAIDDSKLDMMVQEVNQQNKSLQLRETENPGTFLLGVRRLHLSVIGGVLSVRVGGGFITFPEFVKKYGKNEGQRIFDNVSDENTEWASVSSKYGLDETKPEQQDDKPRKVRKSLAPETMNRPSSAMKPSKLRRRSGAQF